MLGRLFTLRPLLLLFALSTWIAFSCVPVATGLVNKQIFDALQARRPGMTLVWLLLAYALVVILGRLAATLWFWVHSTFEPSYEGLMRTNLLQWIIDRSGRRGHRSPALTLTGNVRDDVPGYSDLVNEWYRIFGEASFVVIAAVIMIRIDPLVTLLTLLPLAAVVLFTHLTRTRLPALVARARETTVDVTNVIAGSFGAVRTIKVFGAQDRIVGRLSGLNRSRAQAQVNSESAQAWIDAITQATVNASKGLVLVYAARAMLDGSFTVGDFLLFATYLDWMLDMPRRLGRLLSQYKTTGKSRERLQDALDGEPVEQLTRHRAIHFSGELPSIAQPDRTGLATLTTLSVRDVTFTHRRSDEDEGHPAVSNATFDVVAGSLTVITGEIGSGKSTLLQVVVGLLEADSGEIYWNGAPVDPTTTMRPPRVAYKPQVPRLFSDTLADNVSLGLAIGSESLMQVMEDLAMRPDLEQMPDRLDTVVGARGTRLSGGQVQRVSAARMLARDCSLYVIDDLTSALDDDTEGQVWECLSRVRAEGAALLMVSHRPAMWHRADQLLIMKDGRIEDRGTFEELRKSGSLELALTGQKSDGPG